MQKSVLFLHEFPRCVLLFVILLDVNAWQLQKRE